MKAPARESLITPKCSSRNPADAAGNQCAVEKHARNKAGWEIDRRPLFRPRFDRQDP